MNPDVYEAKMRRGEYFHSLRVPEGMWAVIRLDGRGFTKLTKGLNFDKPFDGTFNGHMINTAIACMEEFHGVFATTHSDEISIAFPSSFDLFDREVEKIVSTTAAVASVAFSGVLGAPATFDSRIWLGATTVDVADYFSWRMHDAVRGAINSYAYWYLRQRKKYTQRQATRELLGKGFSEKNELLFTEFGTNFNETPLWHRRGVGLYYQMREKEGFNPKTNEATKTMRRVLQVDPNLQMKGPFRDWLDINLGLGELYPELRGCFNHEKEAEVFDV